MPCAGRRNRHLLAVAPNASGIICGNTSPSIEPTVLTHTQKTKSGSSLQKNEYLQAILRKTWK